MKIYIAGGFTIMNQIGREKELISMFDNYRRLYSYWFFDQLPNSYQIFNIDKEAQCK